MRYSMTGPSAWSQLTERVVVVGSYTRRFLGALRGTERTNGKKNMFLHFCWKLCVSELLTKHTGPGSYVSFLHHWQQVLHHRCTEQQLPHCNQCLEAAAATRLWWSTLVPESVQRHKISELLCTHAPKGQIQHSRSHRLRPSRLAAACFLHLPFTEWLLVVSSSERKSQTVLWCSEVC